jgi:Protein of unknown function (DUF2550)
MEALAGVGIGVLIVLFGLALLFLRRGLIIRSGGTVELSWRLTNVVAGRGWSPGIGRFAGDELRWYRMFSFSVRPRHTITRQAIALTGRRAPQGPERLTLAPDWVIVRFTCGGADTEIAMAESTLAGFLSWIEAVPPGTVSRRMAAR